MHDRGRRTFIYANARLNAIKTFMQPPLRAACRRRFTLTVLIAATTIADQTFAQDIAIVPKLRVGNAFQLEVIRRHEETRRTHLNGTGRILVDARVVSATSDGFVIEWVPGGTVDDRPATQDSLVA